MYSLTRFRNLQGLFAEKLKKLCPFKLSISIFNFFYWTANSEIKKKSILQCVHGSVFQYIYQNVI